LNQLSLQEVAMQGDFRLDQWLVQPQLNTVVGADNRPVHLEPRLMEVLVYLADHAGEVVSTDRLLRALWQDTFVTQSALTRCIAELRRTFHDDTSNPRIIQTIAKKGYRLIAQVSRPEPAVHAEERPAPPCGGLPKLEDMQAQLREGILPSLAERMDLAEKDLFGENRLVTALFIDLSGITMGSPGLPADSAVERVNRCLGLVTDTVCRYEGSINRFIGDCVLAFFGAPLAHENDAERAVRAALELREAVSTLGFSISIGINTGMTYFGPIGTERHQEVGAYGPDVSLTKRMEEAARPGQILVGRGTYRLTRKTFHWIRLEPLPVKGVEAPVPVYEVTAVSDRPEKLRGIEGLRARMIGRDDEFDEVKAGADQWLSGQGKMVSIIGEAGIGKSRLVAELKEYLGTRQFRCLEGRCLSIGQPISYWPFLDMLRSYFGLSHADSEAELARKATQVVTTLFPRKADEILPFLGRLLSLRFGSELDT
jgi:class 3 adenylate cyclase/DNA-binding winged helix-turn-helix (wHTH) protein